MIINNVEKSSTLLDNNVGRFQVIHMIHMIRMPPMNVICDCIIY